MLRKNKKSATSYLVPLSPKLLEHFNEYLKEYNQLYEPIKDVRTQLVVLDEYLKDCAEHIRWVLKEKF